MKNNKQTLIDFLDSAFVVGGEMIQDNGEDCYAFSVGEKYGLIGVFDGCGGIGSRKYDTYYDKTGAYISSRTLARESVSWFKEFSKGDAVMSGSVAKNACDELYNAFTEKLKKIEAETKVSMMKGSLAKSFPSTASMILFDRQESANKENKLIASFIWAGDSRGFVLTSQGGMSQVTKDDIEENDDALANLSNDGRLTNVVSAAGDYHLNHKMVACSKAGILLTATDGCFAYFSTPMEFEYMILSTLAESETVNEWKEKLNSYMLKYTGDDYTLGIVVFGYRSFKTIKKLYAGRTKMLYDEYISKLDGADEETKISLWNEYKKGYYRGI